MTETTQYERLLEALGVRTQREAAGLLRLPQSKLSDCKRKGGVLSPQVLQAAMTDHDIAPGWILEGVLPMRLPASRKEKREDSACYRQRQCPAAELLEYVLRMIEHCPHLSYINPETLDSVPPRGKRG
jgi:hypothetical protein